MGNKKFKKEEKLGETSYLDLEEYNLHSLENFENMVKSFKADDANYIQVHVDKSYDGEHIYGVNFTPYKAELETDEDVRIREEKENQERFERRKNKELEELERLKNKYGD